jgi:hypothetical protein
LRIGTLAREAQAVVDAAVEPLLDASLLNRTAARVDIARPALLDKPPFLVRELLVKIWRLQRWPRRDMDEWQWNRLAQFIRAETPSPSSFTLPGNIQAAGHGDTVVLQHP